MSISTSTSFHQSGPNGRHIAPWFASETVQTEGETCSGGRSTEVAVRLSSKAAAELLRGSRRALSTLLQSRLSR